MNKTRVIPVLLLRGRGLVKTVKFKGPKYVGDPINAVRIFNEKEVDELVFLDITATLEGRGPDFELLSDIASEAFMPMAYGGGVTSLEQMRRIFELGFEKIIIDSAAYKNLDLISDAAAVFGSQSIVGCIDVRKTIFGRYQLCSGSARVMENVSLLEHLIALTQSGVGEIMVNAVDRDGTMGGYDLKLLREVSAAVTVPVIACGGAGNLVHLVQAVQEGHVSAVAAGSLFVFMGPHRAVLINYPERKVIEGCLP
jgi:cyclase